jgi:xanthosine utilization system XapX-like protein
VLHIRKEDPAERIEGALGTTPSLFEVSLARHQRVDLFLERSDAAVTVTLRERPAALVGLQLAGLLAVVLAIVAELSSVPARRRGLVTLSVAAPVLYALLLVRAPAPRGGDIFGAAVLGLFGGTCIALAAVGGMSAILAWRRAQRRSARAVGRGKSPRTSARRRALARDQTSARQ